LATTPCGDLYTGGNWVYTLFKQNAHSLAMMELLFTAYTVYKTIRTGSCMRKTYH